MSLATELARTFVQASHIVTAAAVQATKTTTGAFGVGVVVVPSTQPALSTVPIDAEDTAFIAQSNQNFYMQFNAKEMFVGRIIQGINKGQGTVIFTEAALNTITFVDNGGFSFPASSGQVVAQTAGYATFVCTEANGTTATLSSLQAGYGGSPVLEIAAGETTAVFGITTNAIISRSSAPATVTVSPIFFNDNGLPGRKISVTQVGGTTGSVTLAAAIGTTATVYSLATGLAFVPVITPGTTMNFVVIGGTSTSVILQQV